MFNLLMRKSFLVITLFIVITGFLVYYNSFSNNFVNDDIVQIVKQPLIHSINKIPLLFISSIPYIQKDGSVTLSYYRPLYFSSLALLYEIGQGQVFVFHLAEVLSHIINVLLIFYFFQRIFTKRLALFLATLFLVHPVNEETVAYVTNLFETMFAIFGLAALIRIQSNDHLTRRQLFLIGFFLSISLLFKETGSLFMILGGLYLFLFKRQNFYKYISISGVVLLINGILHVFAATHYFVSLSAIPLSNHSLFERINLLPRYFFFALKEMILPTDSIHPFATAIRPLLPEEILLQTTALLLFVAIIVIMGWIIYKNKRKRSYYYFFFVFWFFLGISLHMQIIPLDVIIAKRWLYFPFIGFLGMIGCMLEMVTIKKKVLQVMSVTIAVSILLFLSLQTIKMNTYWSTKKSMDAHQVQL